VAAATTRLATSGTCVAVLNYDDVTMLATGVTIANIGNFETITFFVVIDGSTISRDVGVGQSSVIIFPSAKLCTIGVGLINGLPTFIVSGLSRYGIGSVGAF
jgi:hypothetical protein